jgi:hypothetical protein
MVRKRIISIAVALVGLFMMANISLAAIQFEQTVSDPADFIITPTSVEWTFSNYLKDEYKNNVTITDAKLNIKMSVEPKMPIPIPGVDFYIGIVAATEAEKGIFMASTLVGGSRGSVLKPEWEIDLLKIVYSDQILSEITDGTFKVRLDAIGGEFKGMEFSTLKGSAVPIPGSLLLLGSALLGFMVIRRRQDAV